MLIRLVLFGNLPSRRALWPVFGGSMTDKEVIRRGPVRGDICFSAGGGAVLHNGNLPRLGRRATGSRRPGKALLRRNRDDNFLPWPDAIGGQARIGFKNILDGDVDVLFQTVTLRDFG